MTMKVAGIDIGSATTKAVVLIDGEAAGRALVRSGVNPGETAEAVLLSALGQARIEKTGLDRIVTTGYGRRAVNFGYDVVTEISAAARGAFFLGCPPVKPWGKPKLVVDLGGQDTKVILLDAGGGVADFSMNDKCAAGTGRFLEVMAGILEVPLEELGSVSQLATAHVQINSTCTVFAESEVISLIARGTPKEDIVAGLHTAIVGRIMTMVRQMGGHDIFFCGGGARNSGVCRALEELLGHHVYVPPEPQFVVALGASLIAAGAG